VYYSYKGNVFLTVSLVNLLCIGGLVVWAWYSKRKLPLKELSNE
jgi:hypothetical protein